MAVAVQGNRHEAVVNEKQVMQALWIVFAVAAVGLGFQFRDQLEGIFAGRGKLTVTEESGTVWLRWRGAIEAPLHARLEEAFRAHQGGGRFVLSLASPGGKVDHGGDVVRLIKAMQRTHSIDTVVEARGVCASMCVPVFLAGAHRSASPTARFMFHEVSFRDAVTDKRNEVPERAIERGTDQLFERYFRPAGVDELWIADMRKAMRGRDVWRTGAELVDERSGIVQRLE